MVKMGFIGAGSIAVTMANTIKEMDCVEAYAVSARDLKRAQDFAEKYGFEKAYGLSLIHILFLHKFFHIFLHHTQQYPPVKISHVSFIPQLPECHSACSRHIQRIYPVGHWNLHRIIAVCNSRRSQSVPLCPKNDRKSILCH